MAWCLKKKPGSGQFNEKAVRKQLRTLIDKSPNFYFKETNHETTL